MKNISTVASLIWLTTGAALTVSAAEQSYPVRQMRIAVGFQPGGGVDLISRSIAKHLTETFGQSVVVENRPGATGNIAADFVAKSPPDGHTLLMANVTIAMPSIFAKIPFDVSKDLAPVSLIAVGPHLLVVHASVPVKTIKQLIALAKARPKQLIYASGGYGNINHLEVELFNLSTGIEMLHVPYKGGGPSVIGLLSGEAHMLMTSIPSVLPQIKNGRIRALGISTSTRSSIMPDVPTIAEAGVPGYNAASWYGLFTTAGIPSGALATLSKEIVRIMRVPEVRDRFAVDAFDPVGNTPEEFSQFMREEIPKWAKIIKAAKIRAE